MELLTIVLAAYLFPTFMLGLAAVVGAVVLVCVIVAAPPEPPFSWGVCFRSLAWTLGIYGGIHGGLGVLAWVLVLATSWWS